MKLDIIGEIHPTNIVLDLFTGSHLGAQADQRILSYFRPNSGVSPFFVVSDRFWNSLYGYIKNPSEREQETGKLVTGSALYDRDQTQALSELMIEQLEIARSIWGEEAHLLSNGKYQSAYLEGSAACPLDAIAKLNGKRVVYLDENNPSYNFLIDGIFGEGMDGRDYERGQEERENEWIKRIRSGGNSLMICGDAHGRGRFGLVNRFSNRGIDVRSIRSFIDYKDQVERNFEQMQEIRENYLNGLLSY